MILAREGTKPLVIETDHLLVIARAAKLLARRHGAEFRRDREIGAMNAEAD